MLSEAAACPQSQMSYSTIGGAGSVSSGEALASSPLSSLGVVPRILTNKNRVKQQTSLGSQGSSGGNRQPRRGQQGYNSKGQCLGAHRDFVDLSLSLETIAHAPCSVDTLLPGSGTRDAALLTAAPARRAGGRGHQRDAWWFLNLYLGAYRPTLAVEWVCGGGARSSSWVFMSYFPRDFWELACERAKQQRRWCFSFWTRADRR